MSHHHSTSKPRWEVHGVLQMPSATVYTLKWSSQHTALYEPWFQFMFYFKQSLKMYQYKLFQLSIPKKDWHWRLSGLLPIQAAYTSKTKRKTKRKKICSSATAVSSMLAPTWPQSWVWNTTKVTPQLSEPLPQLYPATSMPPSHSGSRVDQNRVLCDRIQRWLLWPQGPETHLTSQQLYGCNSATSVHNLIFFTSPFICPLLGLGLHQGSLHHRAEQVHMITHVEFIYKTRTKPAFPVPRCNSVSYFIEQHSKTCFYSFTELQSIKNIVLS